MKKKRHGKPQRSDQFDFIEFSVFCISLCVDAFCGDGCDVCSTRISTELCNHISFGVWTDELTRSSTKRRPRNSCSTHVRCSHVNYQRFEVRLRWMFLIRFWSLLASLICRPRGMYVGRKHVSLVGRKKDEIHACGQLSVAFARPKSKQKIKRKLLDSASRSWNNCSFSAAFTFFRLFWPLRAYIGFLVQWKSNKNRSTFSHFIARWFKSKK